MSTSREMQLVPSLPSLSHSSIFIALCFASLRHLYPACLWLWSHGDCAWQGASHCSGGQCWLDHCITCFMKHVHNSTSPAILSLKKLGNQSEQILHLHCFDLFLILSIVFSTPKLTAFSFHKLYPSRLPFAFHGLFIEIACFILLTLTFTVLSYI